MLIFSVKLEYPVPFTPHTTKQIISFGWNTSDKIKNKEGTTIKLRDIIQIYVVFLLPLNPLYVETKSNNLNSFFLNT